MQPNPWEKNKSLDSCKKACANQAECEGIIWGYGGCHLRKQIVKKQCHKGKGWTLLEKGGKKKHILMRITHKFLADGWIVSASTNCYTGAGAISMTPNPWETQKSLVSCKKACYNQVECEGIIWGNGACHLRKYIMKNQCKTGQLGKGLTLLQKPEGIISLLHN